MQTGGFLYIEEFNRAPDDTLNTLLTAMADRRLAIPRVGIIQGLPTFRVIASMNPYDNVGTTKLSSSITDRLNRLSVDYQGATAEESIVRLRAKPSSAIAERLVGDAVAVTRATREHPYIRQGSSVRGAIDLVAVAEQLAGLRSIASSDHERYTELVYDAMVVALSGRIHIDEAVDITPEAVLREIWEDRFVLEPAMAKPG